MTVKFRDKLLAPHPFFCLKNLTKTRSSAEKRYFVIVYVILIASENVTSDRATAVA